MHYVGGWWIILEGIRIRLDYAVSRDCKRWILYIGRSRGGGRYTIHIDRQYIGTACGSKGKQGKIGILVSHAMGV